jgi:hypothetical protein
MTKNHAHRIAEVFEEMYPQHVGLAQVITSATIGYIPKPICPSGSPNNI